MARAVTILTQHYYPEVAATGQLLGDLAEQLAGKDFRLSVWTRQPGYERSERAARRENRNGVEILRLPSTRFGRHRIGLRLVDACTFSLALAARLMWVRKTHLLIVSNPPFLIWVGWVAWLARRHSYSLLVHDVYPDVAVRLGVVKHNGCLVKLWRALNRQAYRHACSIVALGERMKSVLLQHPGVEPRTVEVIHNWADPGFIKPLSRRENPFARELGLGDELLVLYSGNMGRFHDLETILAAAERLGARKEIAFLFIGGGAKRDALVSEATRLQLENVRFLPYQPVERLPQTIALGDVGVVSLERGTEGLCVPSKLYTYMAGGLAILALSGPGSEVADIVDRCECGARADQGDVARVVACLETWLEDPQLLEQHKRHSRQSLVAEFSREQAVREYADLLGNLVEQ